MSSDIKEVSIYHEYDECILIQGELTNIDEWQQDLEDGLGNFGLIVLITLQKYQYLNKKNIERVVLLKQRNHWKKGILPKLLKMLRKGGYIEAFGTRNKDMPADYYCTVLYRLTQKGKDVIEKNEESTLSLRREISIEKNGISEVLKLASLNQWHIGILYAYPNRIQTSKYFSFKLENGKRIPSMVECQMKTAEKNFFGSHTAKNVTLFTFPAPRREEEMPDFLMDILRLHNELVISYRYRPALVVAVCENIAHGAWLSWQVNRYRQTRPLYLVYAMDMVTAADNPLSHLYTCDVDEEGILHANVNLLK